MQYNIKRGNASVINLTPTGTQNREAQGADVVDMTFSLPQAFDFKLGDTVEVYGQTYKLNRLPQVQKLSANNYAYTAQFEAYWYDLAKVQYQFLNPQNQLLEPTFDLTGNALTFVDLVVQNANRFGTGWTVGVVDVTDYTTLNFSGRNCLQVLAQLADEFGTEFWIDNKTIHLQKREQSTGYTFQYGKGNGLYNITRQNKSDANIFTRLYVRGGSSNLPSTYGANSLLLPGGATYIEDAGKIALYGLIEASVNFGDIYPNRIGTVSAVTGGDDNWRYFEDDLLTFNVNDYLSPGLEAKVSFTSGQLAGYSFTIASYDNATKRFTINKNTDETSLDIPSNTLRPAVGDKYVLVDISLPQSYVDDAEAKLLTASQAHFDQNSDPKFLLAYSASCDPLFIEQNNITVTLGYTAILLDTDLGINTELRIAKYTRDLQNPNSYPSLEWSDTIGASEIARQYQQQKRTLLLLESSGLLDPAQMRKALFLNRLSENNGYLMLSGQKVKAGLADLATDALHANLADYALDSDKWDGRQFSDYLNQPARTTDDVRFKSITSTSYVSGALGSGFKIDENGDAEFDNLTVRKEFNVAELVVNKIRASNGAIAVTDAGVIDFVIVSDVYGHYISVKELTFADGDVLRCQVFTGTAVKAYWLKVNNLAGGTSFIAETIVGNSADIAVGDTLVRMGNINDADRQGLLYLTASDTNAPYLDVLDGVTSDNLAGKTKVRLGRLDGITDADLGNLSGYGLYTQNGYFKGKVQVTGGNAQTIAGSQALANAAQANAIATAQAQYSALTASLKSMAYKDVVALADLGTTIIEGGKIKTTLLDADYIRANVVNAGYINTLELDAGAIKSGTIDSARINAGQIVANGGGATLTQAQNLANVAQANAIATASSDAQAKADLAQANAQAMVNAVKVGGRNYILSSDQSSTSSAKYLTLSPLINLQSLRGKSVTLSVDWETNNAQYNRLGAELNIRTTSGWIYIGAWFYVPNSPTTAKGRAVGTYQLPDEEVLEIGAMGLYVQTSVISSVSKPKLEFGNKATDWTPAPEDVDQAVADAKQAGLTAQSAYSALTAQLKGMAYKDIVQLADMGSTIIENGKIKTTLLDADYIRANVVNADYVKAKVLEAAFIEDIVTNTILATEITATSIDADTGNISGFTLATEGITRGNANDFIRMGGYNGANSFRVSKTTSGQTNYVDILAGAVVSSNSSGGTALFISGKVALYGLPTGGGKALYVDPSTGQIYRQA